MVMRGRREPRKIKHPFLAPQFKREFEASAEHQSQNGIVQKHESFFEKGEHRLVVTHTQTGEETPIRRWELKIDKNGHVITTRDHTSTRTHVKPESSFDRELTVNSEMHQILSELYS